jgi:hypothetical protein
MKNEIIELLKQARVKIENSENWIKMHTAENSHGWQVFSKDPSACKFCMIGAIASVSSSNETLDVMIKALQNVTLIPVSMFNDSGLTTHKDVLDVFDVAIRMESNVSR